jgi:hypothetical protein
MVWGKRFAQEGRKKALHFIKGRAGADSWEGEDEKSEDAGGDSGKNGRRERVVAGRRATGKGRWLGEGRRSLVVGWQSCDV